MQIRPRSPADIGALTQTAELVHALDKYPPVRLTDLPGFLVSDDALAGWVADEDGHPVGHVALHRRSSDVVMHRASVELRQPEASLGVVARLLVDPAARGKGVGRSLLDTATQEARQRGLTPILDVVTYLNPAIAMYESAGWRRLGQVRFELPNGVGFDEYVYVGPRR